MVCTNPPRSLPAYSNDKQKFLSAYAVQPPLPDAAKETLLVLVATTGQNAVLQAKEFKEASKITGLVLTKLDGTAKGGIVLSIKQELGIPVKFIGVGEKIDDMKPFDGAEFASALFEREEV